MGSFVFYTCDRKMGCTYITLTHANVTFASVTHVKHMIMFVKLIIFHMYTLLYLKALNVTWLFWTFLYKFLKIH